MNLSTEAAKLKKGALSVTFVAKGNSMVPLIKNGDTVTVKQIDTPLKEGDIVLAKVKGHWYLHKIGSIKNDLIKIQNNKGHVNGWTHIKNIVGKI